MGGFPWTLQFSYLLLYALGVVAALWQRGHPLLCLGVLAALIPVGLLSRLPARWFPTWLKQGLQLLVAAGALVWWRHRLGATSIDLMLVEGTVVLGLALAVGGVRREYATLATISFLFLGYGAMSPGRRIYLPVFLAYCSLGIFLMYQTRTLRLLGNDAVLGAAPPKGSGWLYRFLHFALVLTLLATFLALFPLPKGRSEGLVPVSLYTNQQQGFPALWRNWFQPAKTILIDDEGSWMVEGGEDPSVGSEEAETTAETDDAGRFDAREGMGGSGVGKDLVFRVYSPVKLYWLAQLYDVYDGQAWRISDRLRRGRGDLDVLRYAGRQRVEQYFSVEKNVSVKLSGAYRALQILPRTGPAAGDASGSGTFDRLAIRRYVWGGTIVGGLPGVPWNYTCTSLVPTVGNGIGRGERKGLSRSGWNYRALPEKQISRRLRRLAKSLTASCRGPLQKATVLRDFLRNNYRYKLDVPPIPEDREVVDYFLFVSKEGYCQHFAQAMTVLARLAGLPARLATGYSPGNYNVLGGYFEVYEYHGHAWAQVYIPPYGWLTFDGSPPGDLNLDVTPSFLRHLADPFGDEWAARPPEFSVPRASVRRDRWPDEESPASERPGALARAYEQIYSTAAMNSKSANPGIRELAKAAVDNARKWSRELWAGLQDTVAGWGMSLWERFLASCRDWIAYLRSRSASQYVVTIALGSILLWLHRRRERFHRQCRRWLMRYRCLRLWRRLQTMSGGEPDVVVKGCFELSGLLMTLVHRHRPGNTDVLEFADVLAAEVPDLGLPFRTVAEGACLLMFSNQQLPRERAKTSLRAVGELRTAVLGRLSGRRAIP